MEQRLIKRERKRGPETKANASLLPYDWVPTMKVLEWKVVTHFRTGCPGERSSALARYSDQYCNTLRSACTQVFTTAPRSKSNSTTISTFLSLMSIDNRPPQPPANANPCISPKLNAVANQSRHAGTIDHKAFRTVAATMPTATSTSTNTARAPVGELPELVR